MDKRMLPLLGLAFLSLNAMADINVGVTLSASGPAASLGIPEKNSFALVPATIAGQKINYIILDDASDTTAAVKNARKLTGEHKVDVILGSTITPNSLAMVDVAAETQTPMIALAASARIVEPMDEKRRWVFKVAQNDSHMATALFAHMSGNNVRTLAYVGFADAYGEGWWNEVSKLAEGRKIAIVANERYNRSDTSVTGQVLKILAAKPDAVLIGGAGTPAALPQKALREKGYKHLPDSRRGKQRLPACRRQGRGRHLPTRRPGTGGGPTPRRQSDPQGRPGIRDALRGGTRQGQRHDLRRPHSGRDGAARRRDPAGA